MYIFPGEAWIEKARGRHLRQSARLLFDWPCPLPPWLHRPYLQVRDELARLYRLHPGAFLSALALPTISAPLHAAAVRADEGRGLLTVIPGLLLELARQDRLGRAGVFWGAPIHQLLSPACGRALALTPPSVGALFGDGRVELSGGQDVDLRQEWGEPCFFPLADGGWLGLADTNPLAMEEAHPDKHGNALSLGDATHVQWCAALNEARALINWSLPALAAEHQRLLAVVTPVGTWGERSFSASYRESIGQLYVSLTSTRTLAEALIHEVQHNKLNLLSYTDPLLENGHTSFHASPVRPDPRPLWGVLLAVHAFAPVEAMYQQMIARGHPEAQNPDFHIRYRQIVEVNRSGMAVLDDAALPTLTGQVLLAELREALIRLAPAQPPGSA